MDYILPLVVIILIIKFRLNEKQATFINVGYALIKLYPTIKVGLSLLIGIMTILFRFQLELIQLFICCIFLLFIAFYKKIFFQLFLVLIGFGLFSSREVEVKVEKIVSS
jgi:hypothetical protein